MSFIQLDNLGTNETRQDKVEEPASAPITIGRTPFNAVAISLNGDFSFDFNAVLQAHNFTGATMHRAVVNNSVSTIFESGSFRTSQNPVCSS